MDQIYKFVTENQDHYVRLLAEAVKIRRLFLLIYSVSASKEMRPEVVKMCNWIETQLTRLGVSYELRLPGNQMVDGETLKLPPIILARYGTDSKKKTVLVYGHYDVQPALKEDGWATDPWVLTEDSQGRMFGRGSTDDKGPVISWMWVIEIHQKLGIELPVNLIMCFEGMEESGSEGLDQVIFDESGKYFKDVDCCCISDNYWLGTTKPCLTYIIQLKCRYGLRGVQTFQLTVSGPGRDLHSGVFGGSVHEPMTDLINVMATLVDTKGKILIPGIYDTVAPVTPEEKALYPKIEFCLGDIHNASAAKNTIHDSHIDALMARWRFPSLSLHGIEGAYYSSGSKTVIPAKVIGKFSIRSVPNQEPDNITMLVEKHVQDVFSKIGTKNVMKIKCDHAGKCWVADTNHWNFGFFIVDCIVAASKAIEKVFKVTPDLTREGGSIPVTLTFQDALKKSVLLLPMGRADDGAHSINEKLDRSNYVEGIKLLATYLHEVAQS